MDDECDKQVSYNDIHPFSDNAKSGSHLFEKSKMPSIGCHIFK